MNYIKDKIDNVTTEEGFLTADDTNELIHEIANSITDNDMELDGDVKNQLSKAIDIASKDIFYTDEGRADQVELKRSDSKDAIETFRDRMVIFFTPIEANTGDFTIKLKDLAAKNGVNQSGTNVAGFLDPAEVYIAIYRLDTDDFLVHQITSNNGINSDYGEL